MAARKQQPARSPLIDSVLDQALQKPGCPIGNGVRHMEQRFIFCAENAQRERDLAGALCQLWIDTEQRSRVTALGLCYRHAVAALHSWSPSDRTWLLGVLREGTELLLEDTQRFIQKHDYRFANQPFGSEVDVVWRSLDFLLGVEAPRDQQSHAEVPPNAS